MNAENTELLQKLCDACAPSAYENKLSEMIANEIRHMTDDLFLDGMGNLIATRGNKSALLITAHMDEVAFMITGISDDGSLRFQSIGGIDPRSLPSKRLLIGSKGCIGIIGAKPIHLKKKQSETLGFDDLYINIGAKCRDEAEKLVKKGDVAVFNTQFAPWSYGGKTAYSGKALDNRIGCYLLIRLLRETNVDGTFVFTVQEEVGTRGAQALCFQNAYSLAIALDTTTANDLPCVTAADCVCKVGHGIVISYADGATVYDRRLVRGALDLLESKGILAQTKSRRTGGNEAAAIQKCGLGSPVLSLSTPCRYIHAGAGLVQEEDVDQSFLALKTIIRHYEKGGFQLA